MEDTDGKRPILMLFILIFGPASLRGKSLGVPYCSPFNLTEGFNVLNAPKTLQNVNPK